MCFQDDELPLHDPGVCYPGGREGRHALAYEGIAFAWLQDGKVERAAMLAVAIQRLREAIGVSGDIEGAPTRQALQGGLADALDDETRQRAETRRRRHDARRDAPLRARILIREVSMRGQVAHRCLDDSPPLPYKYLYV